jgi:hypothetical protein
VPLPEGLIVSGEFETTTDAEGRFEVPRLAGGRIILAPSQLAPDLIRISGGENVLDEGGQTDLNIKLEKAVLVRGKIREQGTNRPIEGVVLRIGWAIMRTNATGAYQAFVLPGQISMRIFFSEPFIPTRTPDATGFFSLGILEEGAQELNLPPFELVRRAEK